MPKIPNWLLATGSILALILVIAGIRNSLSLSNESQIPSCQLNLLPQENISFNDNPITISVASTSAQRAQGLSGCTEIPPNTGMLFKFQEPKKTAFWMKHMLIPIDIIWISNNQIIGIEKNVPPPADITTPDSDLAQYISPSEVDSVLELGAGEVARLKIDINSEIK